MISAPNETPDDLAERYRQTRGFDLAEVRLVEYLSSDRDPPPHHDANQLRLILNLARLWVLDQDDGSSLAVGPKLGSFREKARLFAQEIRDADTMNSEELVRHARQLEPHLTEAIQSLKREFRGTMSSSELRRELCHKKLTLVLGGGGGCGYVHLGALSLLEELKIRPGLVVGSSLGSIRGLFRCMHQQYKAEMIERVTSGLSFKNLFRVLEGQPRYGLPGTLRLYLRSAMAKFFMNDNAEVVTLSELAIPFICVVTGVRRDVVKSDFAKYEHEFAKRLRRGPLGALLHVTELVKSWSTLIKDLIMSGGIKPIPLGMCQNSQTFDALDAVGFSCSVPALIHYDILRDDPRMHNLTRNLLKSHNVDHLIDGGISANVPARCAWEAIQRGHIKTRNSFIMGLDCFAPQLRRNMIFLPMMRLAAENVSRDRHFANLMFTYRKVLSPASLIPNARSLRRAINHGRDELSVEKSFLKTMLEPLEMPESTT